MIDMGAGKIYIVKAQEAKGRHSGFNLFLVMMKEDTSEKIKAISTVVIKFIICRNISGYEHGAGYCTSKMEKLLNTEVPHPRKYAIVI